MERRLVRLRNRGELARLYADYAGRRNNIPPEVVDISSSEADSDDDGVVAELGMAVHEETPPHSPIRELGMHLPPPIGVELNPVAAPTNDPEPMKIKTDLGISDEVDNDNNGNTKPSEDSNSEVDNSPLLPDEGNGGATSSNPTASKTKMGGDDSIAAASDIGCPAI